MGDDSFPDAAFVEINLQKPACKKVGLNLFGLMPMAAILNQA